MVRSTLTHCSSVSSLCCRLFFSARCQQDDHLCHITESHCKAWIPKTVWCSISGEYCLTKCSAQGQGAGSGVRKGWCHCPGNTSESLLTWIFNLQHIIQSDTTLLPMTYFDLKGELSVQHLALNAPLVSLHAGWHNSAASVSLPPKTPSLLALEARGKGNMTCVYAGILHHARTVWEKRANVRPQTTTFPFLFSFALIMVNKDFKILHLWHWWHFALGENAFVKMERDPMLLKFGSTVRRYREKSIGSRTEPWGSVTKKDVGHSVSTR